MVIDTRDNKMIINKYLKVSNKGKVILGSRRPAPSYVSNNEIVLSVNIDIPDSYFSRPEPIITFTLPPLAIVSPGIKASIEIAAKEISKKLMVDKNDVINGIQSAVDKKNGNRNTKL